MAVFTVWKCDLCGGESRAPKHQEREGSFFGFRCVDGQEICKECHEKLTKFFDTLRNKPTAK